MSKLPAYPEKLRREPQVTINGALLSTAPYAVVFTPDQALVWAYNVNTSVPETFDVDLPRPTKYQHQAAPVGCLVTPLSSGDEPGLVVIQPATGKITYWESVVSAAASAALSNHRIGVEGSVPLLSGETVTGLQAIDPAGYVIVLSTGRLAHLCLHDSQGKSAIHLQIVRGAADHANVGSLGSWFHTLTTKTFRRDIAAVRCAGSTERGQRQVVVATVKGDIQLWSFNRNKQYSLLIDVDAKNELIAASRPRASKASDWTEYDFSLLDVVCLPNDETSSQIIDKSRASASPAIRLLVLTLNQTNVSFIYHLLEIVVSDGRPEVIHSQGIKNYDSPIHHREYGLPRLLVPEPGHTAFIIFAQSVIILSREVVQVTPPDSQQLLVEATATKSDGRSYYEDVVDFRQDRSIRVVTAGAEDAARFDALASMAPTLDRRNPANPACVLLVEGVGLVRLTANASLDESKKRPKVTPKSKMEQAVFYGKIADDILDMANRVPLWFKPEVIENAAVRISSEIMTSTSKYMSSDQEPIEKRMAGLEVLSNNIREYYPSISPQGKWQILGSMEKLVAMKSITRILTTDAHDYLLEMLSDQFGIDSALSQAQGAEATAKQMLANVARMQDLACGPYATFVNLNMLRGHKSLEQTVLNIQHATECFLAIYEPVLEYRMEHHGLFNLVMPHPDTRSISPEQRPQVPELWTTSGMNLEGAIHLVELVSGIVTQAWEDEQSTEELKALAAKLPRLITILCSLYEERIVVPRVLDLPPDKDEDPAVNPDAMAVDYARTRHELITSLGELNMLEKSYELAEQYRDGRSLAKLVLQEHAVIDHQARYSRHLPYASNKLIQTLAERTERYTERFGEGFANCYFEQSVRFGFPKIFLDLPTYLEPYFDKYCLIEPRVLKLAGLRNMEKGRWSVASQELLQSAHDEDEESWDRKILFSLAKLASLTVDQPTDQADPSSAKVGAACDAQYELQAIQDKLHRHMHPSIRTAIDHIESLNIALADFGQRFSKFDFTKQYLRSCLAKLFAHKPLRPIELIETLTMIDQQRDYEVTSGISGNQFWLALNALNLAKDRIGSRNVINAIERSIWRRCYGRDDWKAITKSKATGLARDRVIENTALFQTLKHGYAHSRCYSIRSPGHNFCKYTDMKFV